MVLHRLLLETWSIKEYYSRKDMDIWRTNKDQVFWFYVKKVKIKKRRFNQ